MRQQEKKDKKERKKKEKRKKKSFPLNPYLRRKIKERRKQASDTEERIKEKEKKYQPFFVLLSFQLFL